MTASRVSRVADDDELRALRAGCTEFLHGHGPRTAAALLATIPAGT
jgi:hypothetical protein